MQRKPLLKFLFELTNLFFSFDYRQSKKLNDNDESIDNDEEEMLTKMMSSQMYLTRLDVLKDLEKIWTNEKEVLAIYLATLRSSHHSIRHVHNNSISLFFFQVLSFNSQKFENPKTVRYSTIIQDNQYMKEILLLKDKQTTDISTSTTLRYFYYFSNNRSSLTNTLRRITNEEKLNNLWVKIEITVNSIFDSSLDNRSGARVAKGIRQLEYLTIFGKKLTYTELVTRDNLHELRQLILNQPDVHPGGNFVELEDGTIRRLLPNNLFQRTAVAKL
ncbi:unnamed protein product [Rotaria sordida]|uniref:Uncharacterized protein n=1 Tax=Rotaria sordida TaxID=392033 RepID=A0A815PPQ7_9BILA|nr:unnamed protein product [Rotaria sordida]